jgi:hypothetical protein
LHQQTTDIELGVYHPQMSTLHGTSLLEHSRATSRNLALSISKGVALHGAVFITQTANPPCRRYKHRHVESVVTCSSRRQISRSSSSTELVALTEPISKLDVDRDLWEVLDLCSNEELEAVYNILYGSSPLSPVVKSLVKENEPCMVERRGRTSIMHKVGYVLLQQGPCPGVLLTPGLSNCR